MTPLEMAELYELEADNIRKGVTKQKFDASSPERQKAHVLSQSGFMPLRGRTAARERVRAKYFSNPDLVNKARAMRAAFTPHYQVTAQDRADFNQATTLVEAALASRRPRGYSHFGVRPSRNALCMPRRGSIF